MVLAGMLLFPRQSLSTVQQLVSMSAGMMARAVMTVAASQVSSSVQQLVSMTAKGVGMLPLPRQPLSTVQQLVSMSARTVARVVMVLVMAEFSTILQGSAKPVRQHRRLVGLLGRVQQQRCVCGAARPWVVVQLLRPAVASRIRSKRVRGP
mgnify:CR=1 FL=1